MLTDLRESLEQFIPALKEKKQVQLLALQAEIVVRKFSGLPPINVDDRDAVEILKSICLLLERFQKYPELLSPNDPPPTPPMAVVETAEIQPLVVPLPAEKNTERQLSATAQACMSLRDWVLLANSNQGEDKSDSVLATIYDKLGTILELEGLISLQETGFFNYEKQKIVATQVTDDISKDDLICATVRPGYLFNQILIRPQEVVVYAHSNTTILPPA